MDQEGFVKKAILSYKIRDRQGTMEILELDTFLRETYLTPKMHACSVKYNMQENIEKL